MAEGVHLPVRRDFVPVPRRPFSRGYSENQPLVHARVAKDAAKGRFLLLNAAAASVVRVRDTVNDCPFGHVPKKGEPPPKLGRVTTNASAGLGGAYPGSLNDATCPASIEAVFGPADVHTLPQVARMLCAATRRSRGCPLGTAVADADSAFMRLALCSFASLLLSSSMDPGKDQRTPAMAIPTVGNFGWAGMPAAFHVAIRAVLWLVDTQPVRWWRCGFERFRASEPGKAHSVLPPLAEVQQSMLAAMAFVFCPHDKSWPILNMKKVFVPGPLSVQAGWAIDCESRCFRLTRRGLLKVARSVFGILWPKRAPWPVADFESAKDTLSHYCQAWPWATPFLASLRHAFLRCRRAKAVPLDASPSLAEDLRWWRAAISAVWRQKASWSVEWSVLAMESACSVTARTDASGFGGGVFILSDITKCAQALQLPPIRCAWTEPEVLAMALPADASPPWVRQKYGRPTHINVGEFAVAVFFILLVGLVCPSGQVVALQLDNTAAISWCSKHRAKSPAAFQLARLMAWACTRFSIVVQASHIRGVLNVESDALSRWDEPAKRLWWAESQLPQPVHVQPPDFSAAGRAREMVRRAIVGSLEPGWLGRIETFLQPGPWARQW